MNDKFELPKVDIKIDKEQWIEALNTCRHTMNKQPINKQPSDEWREKLIRSEHSPLRMVPITITLSDLESWVSVHITRHKNGVEHFVTTQRTDRTKVDRRKSKQSALVSHKMYLNPQSLINIMKERLCFQSAPETTMVFQGIKNALKEIDPILSKACVPKCVYRNGICPEFTSCDFHKSQSQQKQINNYINTWVKQ